MPDSLRMYILPYDVSGRVEKAVIDWLESEGYEIILVRRPGGIPTPVPSPLPVPAPTPAPVPIPIVFPAGTFIKVKYNAQLYYAPDDPDKKWKTVIDHPQYEVQAVLDEWRKLQNYPPFDVWARVEDLEVVV